MRRPHLLALALCVAATALFALPPLAARDERPPLDEAPAALRDALLDGDFENALAQLVELERSEPTRGDLWAMLRGQIHATRGEAALAEQDFAAVESRFAGTPWRSKARFGRASALRDLRRFAEAEAIVASEAARLRSPERRTELAQLAVDLADAALDPKAAGAAETPASDPALAFALYEQVLGLDPPAPVVAHVQRQRGRCLLALGQPGPALVAFTAYLASPAGRERSGVSIDARLAAARCEAALGRVGDARRSLERLATELSQAPEPAMRARLGDALEAAARTWRPDLATERLLAVTSLRRFVEQCPDHPLAWTARLDAASYLAAAGETEEALAAFDAIIAGPAGAAAEEATRARAEAAFRRGQLLLSQGRCEAAGAAFADCVARDPTGPRWAEAQAAMVEAEYRVAAIARDRKEFAAARAALTRFISLHPLDPRVAESRFEIGALYRDEAEQLRQANGSSSVEPALSLERSALEEWQRCVRLHPGSDVASHALFASGRLWHDSLLDLEKAVEMWRACSFGAYAGEAAGRLAELLTPSLSVVTPRSFRSNEAAHLELLARNVAQVKVKLHRLDLEAYFRKFLAADAVEELDLDLIAADLEFTFDVPDYARWKACRAPITLPLLGSGAWVAVVESEQQRTTTLVLKSDIDLIVKSAARELLVFAENRLLGTAAAGVELLIDLGAGEDGSRRQHTGTTGSDGLFHLRTETPFEPSALRMLAKSAADFAVVQVPLQGGASAPTLLPRGLVFTDRPAYRPGQQVEIAAFLRDVKEGSLTASKGSRWTLSLHDPRDRLVRSETLLLDEFGTAAAKFELDAFATLGTWMVVVERQDGPTFRGSFLVADYQLERVTLDLTAPRRVWFRGETIEVEGLARWQHGAPVADAALRVELPDGRIEEMRTDAQGQFRIRFETVDLPEERALAFQATLLDGGVVASETIFLALREFDLSLELPTRALLADERFAIGVRATRRDGTPMATPCRVALLRKESGGGEVRAQQLTGTTLAADGRTTFEATLARGGTYVVRAEATDRFGQRIVAEGMVLISDSDDEQKLRLLSDRTRLEVGESTKVRLLQRDGGGLLLLTWELHDGLRWQVLDAREATRELTITADAELAPGFVLAAAAMRGTRLHIASTPFEVTRALRLTVVPRTATATPGGELTVDFTTADPLGRPLSARVALAVVDDALLRQFPDTTPLPERVFALGGGAPAPWRLSSSCTFRYEAAPVAIARTVRDEEARQVATAEFDREKGGFLTMLGYLGDGGGGDGPASEERPAADPAGNADDLVRATTGGGGGGFLSGRLNRNAVARSKQREEAGRAAPAGLAEAGLDDDTACFAPAITTDAEGKASVTFRLPQRSTTWQLVARGLSVDSRAALAQQSIVAREPFFAELRAPATLRQGDTPRLLATLFSEPGAVGQVELRLRVHLGDQVTSLPATLALSQSGTTEHLFPALAALPLTADAKFELVATQVGVTPAREQRSTLTLPIEPFGLERRAAKSGELRSSARFTLELPGEVSYVARSLDLWIAPSAARLLLDDALERTLDRRNAPRVQPQADVATELLGTCEVLALGQQLVTGAAASELDLAALRSQAQGLLARLVVTQRDDGGFAWAGDHGSDRPTTALALVALARAQALGFAVPVATMGAARQYVETAFRNSGPDSDELKAMLQLALAGQGAADAAALQRLHRVRATLSPAALAYTCLALVASGKEPMAIDLAALIEQRAIVAPAGGASRCWDAQQNRRFQRSPLETSALALLALSAATPASPTLAGAVDALLAERPWAPARAAGLVRAALARFYADVVPERSEAVVRVRVNDRLLPPVLMPAGAGAQAVAIPAELLREGKVKVELELEGRARPSYAALLRGFTPDVRRTDRDDLRWSNVVVSAPAPLLRGRPLDTGFSVLSETPRDSWINTRAELAVGELAEVQLSCYLGRESVDADDTDPYELAVALPAGVELLPGSLNGNFTTFALRPGAIDVRLLRTSSWTSLRFTVVGRVPGDWRALPPQARSAVELHRAANGEEWKLRVLPVGAKSADPYRPTPDELFSRGKRLFEAGERAAAAVPLEALVAEFGAKLKEAAQREVARMLLACALEAGDATRIVRSFETVKEKDPALALPADEVRAVAAAYRSLEEHEPALELTRALIDETFRRDLQLPAMLAGANRMRASFELRERLWLDYPDTPAVKQSYLALSDDLLALAPRAHESALLRAEKLDRATLQRDGMRILMRFLAFSPSDPLAPEAGLGLVTAWLAIEEWEAASGLAERLAKRWSEPRFADSFLYSKAVAEWSLGHDDAARALLERIAVAEYVDASGRKVPSVNRDLAWYILAQIHHARRDAAAAMRCYEKVAGAFPDARDALHGLRERLLELPEVTSARPGEKPQVELRSKNLARAQLLVYPVDLMTLCLREKNLSGIAGVNLAGIAPAARLDVDLAKESQFEPHTTKVALDLPQAGAYLVLVRADEHHASGLVLVTPLDLQVKEESDGRMRIHVQDAASGAFLRDVDVRVIGSRNDAFTAGRTDPRGLFVAEGLEGTATVIARAGERAYAFWRGARQLGREEQSKRKEAEHGGDDQFREQGDYLKNVVELNRGLQQQRASNLEQEFKKAGQAVPVQSQQEE